jgi:hypothetical protein
MFDLHFEIHDLIAADEEGEAMVAHEHPLREVAWTQSVH